MAVGADRSVHSDPRLRQMGVSLRRLPSGSRCYAFITSVERIGMQQGMEKGLQQGLQQGMQQGKQEGIHQGQAEMVLRLLNRRFGAVPL